MRQMAQRPRTALYLNLSLKSSLPCIIDLNALEFATSNSLITNSRHYLIYTLPRLILV